MPWKTFDFRGQDVWVRVLPDGKPIVRRGLVELRYKKGATKSYRSHRENLEPAENPEQLSDADFGGAAAPKKDKIREQPSQPADVV